MRIIAGTHRGRPLQAPRGRGTRPILDRQKESLFNVLRESLPCSGVVDVFAGSGGLGFEALSRGAERATFVERGRPAVVALEQNVASLGFEERAKVLVRDAFAVSPAGLHPFGLLFLDPPFALYRERAGRVHTLLASLLESPGCEDGAVAVLRVPADAEVPGWPTGVEEVERRPAGESVIILLRRDS